jgi:all-trans-retinol 13,14-reductase
MAIYDAVIIGGGLGGLLCGNILSKEGLNVCLVEKNHKLGGSLQTFGRKGCIFNTGLNYTESLDEGQVLNRYFRYFGLMGKLKLQKLNPDGFEVIDFNNGRYRFAMGREHFVETLARDFSSQRKGLEQYTAKIREICHSVSLYSFNNQQSNLIDNSYLTIGAADYIDSVISNPRLRNILAGNSMLYSGTDNKTPLFIHALINNSFIESAWRIADGSHNVVNILADNMISAGATILRNHKADRIIVRNGRAEALSCSDGTLIEGRNFIANIHPAQVIDMVEPGILRKVFRNRITSLENTMGMFTLYLVFKPGTMPYHNFNFYHFEQDNVWVAAHYNNSQWPQNYLFMPTAMSDLGGYARSASVITYMDFQEVCIWELTFTGDRGADYLAFKEEKAQLLLDAVQRQYPEIRNRILAYYTSTPLTWRDYTGTKAGSAYGVLKDYNRPLETMILPKTQIPNVFLTGQNTNVHGILGVTISSVVTCSELIDGNYLLNRIKSC